MATIYENIKSLCDEKGIRGGKMCVDIGLSKSLMTGLKNGQRTGISATTAQKIADYFGVTIDRVIGENNEIGVNNVKSNLNSTEQEAWKIIRDTANKVLGSDQKEKSPTPDGVELDEETMELLEAWNSGDEAKEFLLSAARMIKARRQSGD